MLYLPDEVVHLRADTVTTATHAFRVVERLPNPMGVVPVVPLRNSDLLEDGCSEITDLMPLVEASTKCSPT
ncbi:hypothetical protein AU186_00120 [Mycobacterium sp. GA-1999]|nr:hypothetical protein AU185_02350 [Mycobacterium sp. GA-0227b]KUH87098.1 hypothetical protein AU186_00120 [Mycobacterium sp. GA-1999]